MRNEAGGLGKHGHRPWEAMGKRSLWLREAVGAVNAEAFKCGMQNAECGISRTRGRVTVNTEFTEAQCTPWRANAECGMRNSARFGVQMLNAECGMRNEGREDGFAQSCQANAECKMRNAEFRVRAGGLRSTQSSQRDRGAEAL